MARFVFVLKVVSCQFNILLQPYGIFVSNGTQGGGQVHSRSHARAHARAHLIPSQESAIFGSLANFTHHGMIFVPIGYRYACAPHVGSPVVKFAVGELLRRCNLLPVAHHRLTSCTAPCFSPIWLKFTAPARGVQVQCIKLAL